MRSLWTYLLIILVANALSLKAQEQLKIRWLDHLAGDFSFSKQWDYPQGIYRNAHGQISCDSFCPERTDAMKDSTGRVFDDSLAVFYSLVDTTHQFHTILCEAQCDEWAGTDYIDARRSGDTIICLTAYSIATHASLEIRLHGNTCEASVILNSIVPGSDAIYYLKKGLICIDRKLWRAGVLKAEFNMNFGQDSITHKPVSWKGKIYTPVLN